jgi:hypothetical protein
MTLQEAAADLVLTGGRPERMPDQAVAWMTEGYDSPALIELAGLNRNDDVNDLRTLYDRTLRELGVEPPSHLEAAQIIISAYATDVVEGRLSPIEGAQQILKVHNSVNVESEQYVGETLGLARLLGAYYQLEDFMTGSPEFEKLTRDLLVECRILAGDRPDANA